MPGIPTSAMLDLLQTTTENLPNNVLPFELDYQQYEVCNRLFAKDRVELQGGTALAKRVVLDKAGAAKHVRAYETEAVNVVNVVSNLRADWVRADTNWSIERGEMAMNRSGTSKDGWSKGFIQLIKTRRQPAMVDLANEMEEKFWQVPGVDVDNLTPLGFPYWVPKLAVGQAANAKGFYGGRYGGAGGAFTSVGGIVPATAGDNTVAIAGGKPLWRSYQCGYVSINDAAIKQMSEMFYKIQFRSPMMVKDLVTPGATRNNRIWLNTETLVDFEAFMRKSNDQIGSDLAKYMGLTSFKRQPLVPMVILDANGVGEVGEFDPVYFANLNAFRTYVLSDFYLVERQPIISPSNHNVFTTYVDLIYCYLAWSRRTQGVMNKVVCA